MKIVFVWLYQEEQVQFLASPEQGNAKITLSAMKLKDGLSSDRFSSGQFSSDHRHIRD